MSRHSPIFRLNIRRIRTTTAWVALLGAFLLFGVSACNSGSTSSSTQSASPAQSAAPTAPTGFAAAAGDKQVTLTWPDVTSATGYNVYWAKATGVTPQTGTQIAGVTSPYVHTALTNGTTYYYVATATNAGGESPPSPESSATPQISAPGAPKNLAAAAGSNLVWLSWDAVPGATGYNLYRSTTSGAGLSGTQVSASANPYPDSPLAAGVPVYYVVTALNAGGESAPSAEAGATPQAAPMQVQSVALGGGHTMAIVDGKLYAWGLNGNSQLGDGTTTDQASPLRIGTDATWVSVSAGNAHTVAVKMDGTLWAWGEQDYGALGLGNCSATEAGCVDIQVPTQVGSDTDWTLVSAGANHTLAQKKDGSLWGFGDNGSGAVGVNSTDTTIWVPTLIATSSDTWTAFSAGDDFSLAIKSDGTLWGWGSDRQNQLGLPIILGCLEKCLISEGSSNYIAPQEVDAGTWKAVASGENHGLGIKSDGTLYSWGNNGAGQLGLANVSSAAVTQVGTDTNWAAVAAGSEVSLALKSDGTLWVWGDNTYGLLDSSDLDTITEPTQLGGAANWAALPGGLNSAIHLAAVNDTRQLSAWGSNDYGQVGVGTMGQKLTPTPLDSANTYLAAQAGPSYTIVIRQSDHALFGFGYNWFGQLGVNADSATRQAIQVQTPMQESAQKAWSAAAAGFDHVAALDTDSHVFTWGYNGCGQLGNGTYSDSLIPLQLDENTYRAVAAGDCHSLAIRSDGTLWSWGDNSYGELGDGSYANAVYTNPLPSQEATGSRQWTKVFSDPSSLYSMGLQDFALYGWGYNYYGQVIGDGTSSSVQATPYGVDFADPGPAFTFVSSSWALTLGIRGNDGTLWGWGSGTGPGGESLSYSSIIQLSAPPNSEVWATVSAAGSLGITDQNHMYSWASGQITEIGHGTSWMSVSAQSDHAVALDAAGHLYVWGDNSSGQLGTGDAWILSPTGVTFP